VLTPLRICNLLYIRTLRNLAFLEYLHLAALELDSSALDVFAPQPVHHRFNIVSLPEPTRLFKVRRDWDAFLEVSLPVRIGCGGRRSRIILTRYVIDILCGCPVPFQAVNETLTRSIARRNIMVWLRASGTRRETLRRRAICMVYNYLLFLGAVQTKARPVPPPTRYRG
jgi:hypothetical protein